MLARQHSNTPSSSKGREVPIGFNIKDCSINAEDVNQGLRFRRDDKSLLESGSCVVEAAYLPLIAVLFPKWLETINQCGHKNSKKIIFLISGRGAPRTLDPLARMVDNSTKYTAMIMSTFINIIAPDVQVIHVHSITNLFRYDENIIFVKRELLPLIDAIRDNLADRVGSKWREMMRVTLSFADGSSARISAINASLRHYRPDYMHFWQLKTFWSENVICEDDVEIHSFEEISTEPAIDIETDDYSLNANVKLVVAEMIKFKDEFNRITNTAIDTDLSSFWLRKTRKPVLAVLLVQQGHTVKLYRGTNMEVSMPTGSLCAERNVIGSALADNIALKREDLKYIAVYSAKTILENKSRAGSLEDRLENKSRAGSLEDRLLDSKSRAGSLEDRADMNIDVPKSPLPGQKRKMMRMPSFQSVSPDNGTLANLSIPPNSPDIIPPARIRRLSSGTRGVPSARITTNNRLNESTLPSTVFDIDNDGKDYDDEDETKLGEFCLPSSKTIFVEDGDMNPLKPCGSCHEWLKKIAEINPQFSVITFTDFNCTGVYIEQIKD